MKKKNPHAVEMGRMKSDKKTKAVRENGKKGGRPKCICLEDNKLTQAVCPVHRKVTGDGG